MLTLAVLLQLAGLIFTFTLGIAGYVIGPLALIAGGLLTLGQLVELQWHLPKRAPR